MLKAPKIYPISVSLYPADVSDRFLPNIGHILTNYAA
jgi:hypothetical protein